MSNVIVGTENGLFALAEGAGTWSIAASYLPDKQISVIARENDSSVLASTLGDGLFRVDLAKQTVEPLGAGVMPAKLRGVTISPLGPRIFVSCEPAAIWTSGDGGKTWTENPSVKALAQEQQWKYPVPSVPSHIRNVLVSWDDPRYMYAAVQVGGILRSEDVGETWTLADRDFDPDIHSLMQHPTDPTLLFAIGGGGGPVGGPPRTEPLVAPLGKPFFRSRDRGRTWECVSTDFDRTYGIGMAGVPAQTPVLVAGVARDQPPFWRKREERADAIMLMSSDNGTTWQQCRDGLPDYFPTMIEAVEVDRRHGNRVLIGTGGGRQRDASGERVVGGAESAIYVSEDPAGHWVRLPVALPGVSAIVAL
jgi:hypothetical protein